VAFQFFKNGVRFSFHLQIASHHFGGNFKANPAAEIHSRQISFFPPEWRHVPKGPQFTGTNCIVGWWILK